MRQITRSAGRRLTVLDERYINPAIAVGWRRASAVADVHLRAGIEAAVSAAKTPIVSDWSASGGTDVVSALLSQREASGWLHGLLDLIADSGTDHPVLAVVGNEEAIRSTESALHRTGRLLPVRSPGLQSFVKQRTVSGTTVVTVVGADPAERYGSAATVLASALAMRGEQALVPQAVGKLAPAASIDFTRRLHELTPAIMWRLRVQGRGGLLLLEAIWDELGEYRVAPGDPRLFEARTSAREVMGGFWESPLSLARALVRYEVMGWGPNLVLRPDEAFLHSDAGEIETALHRLLRPIAESLGRT